MSPWLTITLALGCLLAGLLLLAMRPGKGEGAEADAPQEEPLPPEVLSSIRELRLDRDTGKISTEEYEEGKAALLAELPGMVDARREATRGLEAGRISLSLGFNLVAVVVILGVLGAWHREQARAARQTSSLGALQTQLNDMQSQMADTQDQGVPPEVQAMVDRLKERLKKEPDDLQGQLMLGRSMMQLGNLPEAKDAFMAAAKLDPQNAEAVFGLGMVLVGSEEWAAAAKAMDQALERDPDHLQALFIGAALCERLGEKDKGLTLLSRLNTILQTRLEANPGDEETQRFVQEAEMLRTRLEDPSGKKE